MSRSFKADYSFGIKSEIEVLDKLNEFFKDNIKSTESSYCKYDFKGDKYIYELKTRTNRKDEYPDTIFPADKIVGDNLILLFKFTDGLYYIKYDEKIFSEFKTNDFQRRRRYDYYDKIKPYIYIPVSNLLPVS